MVRWAGLAGEGGGAGPGPCLTFLELLQVLCVVGAVGPAGDAQHLQVKAGGQRHGLWLPGRRALWVGLCTVHRHSERKGWGQTPPPAFGALLTAVPPSTVTSQPPPGQLTRLVQSPPRPPPQVLSPKCPSSHRPSSSDDESKSWADPESPVHPLSAADGGPWPRGAHSASRSDDGLTQSPVF